MIVEKNYLFHYIRFKNFQKDAGKQKDYAKVK